MKKISNRILALIMSICIICGLMPVRVSAMAVFVNVEHGGSIIQLDVEPADSIESVKHKLNDETGISEEDQILTYNGVVLESGNTLADCGIQEGATLSLEQAAPAAEYYFVSVINAANGATNAYGTTSGTGTYAAGDTVTLIANTSSDEYCFLRFNVSAGGVTSPADGIRTFTFTMPAENVHITAQFADHHPTRYLDLEDGNHTHYCMYCKTVYIESEAHSLTEYEDNGESGHYANCDKFCNYQTPLEAHVYDDEADTVCDVCGHVREIHIHAWGDWLPNGDGSHSRSCADGSSHSETEACDYVDDNSTVYCAVCGYVLHVHDYSPIVTEPSCTEKGYTTHTCSCGDEYIDSYVDALGHDYAPWGSQDDDTHTRTCMRDSSHTETENCYGGTADCSYWARCAVCRGKYGDLNIYYHADYGWEWNCNHYSHFKACLGCHSFYVNSINDNSYTGPHDYSSFEDTTCNICGYDNDVEHIHRWSAWTYNGDGTHSRTCSYNSSTGSSFNPDTSHTETEACYDTADDDYLCDACGNTMSSGSIIGSMPNATADEAYSYQFQCSGTFSGIKFWNATGLPEGLSIHVSNGTVSGTPTTAGSYTVTVSVGATGGGSASADFTLVVEEAPHEHSYSIEWDSNNHWLGCACGAYKDVADHEFKIDQTDTEHSYRCEGCGYGWYGPHLDYDKDEKCNSCGYDMHVHSYASTVTEPSCTEKGYTTHSCACGDSYVDSYVDALGHTPGEAATCTTPQVCEVCGEVLAEATGHSYASTVTEPTCTEKGYTTHTCSCGDSYVDSYVDALGHTPGEEASCTTPQVCEVCGEVLTEATGHSYASTITEPSCTAKGYTTHTCSCGDSYIDSYVDALGHTPGEEASCTAPQICEVCGEVLTEATGHSYSAEVVPPDCAEQGFTIHRCPCGHLYIDSYTEAVGHNYGPWEPRGNGSHIRTCDKDGSFFAERCSDGDDTDELCDSCGYDMHVHSYTPTVTAPTCAGKGYTTHSCACGDSYIDSYVDALGHTPGEAASCTAPQACTVCGAPYGAKDETNHAGGTELRNAKEASETEDGYTGDTYCLGCDALISEGETIPATGGGDDDAHTHEYKRLYNDTHHWYECSCGDVMNYAKHSIITSTGNCLFCDYHEHRWYIRRNDNGTHTRICEYDSSHTKTEDCYGSWATNDSRHSMDCRACGASIVPSGLHVYSDHYDLICDVCEYERASNTHENKILYNDTHHWDECSCGDVMNYAKHSITTSTGNCTYCDYHEHKWYTQRIDNGTHTRICEYDSSHTKTEDCYGSWATDDSRHRLYCRACGASIVPSGLHVYSDNYDLFCNVCEYERASNTHEYKRLYNDTHHWDECSCGDVMNYAKHSITTSTGNCLFCDYHEHRWYAQRNDNGTHTRICEYDSSHTKTEDCYGSWATDDSSHSMDCSACGASIVPSGLHVYSDNYDLFCNVCEYEREPVYHIHSYTEANCIAPATCSCGAIKGIKDSRNHVGETELRNAVAPTRDSGGYSGDTYCLSCGAMTKAGRKLGPLGYAIADDPNTEDGSANSAPISDGQGGEIGTVSISSEDANAIPAGAKLISEPIDENTAMQLIAQALLGIPGDETPVSPDEITPPEEAPQENDEAKAEAPDEITPPEEAPQENDEAEAEAPNDGTKNGWHKDGSNWTYWKDGRQVTGWLQDRGDERFYCDRKTGYMETGWFQDGGSTWYYGLGWDGSSPGGVIAANQWRLVNVNGNGTYQMTVNPSDTKFMQQNLLGTSIPGTNLMYQAGNAYQFTMISGNNINLLGSDGTPVDPNGAVDLGFALSDTARDIGANADALIITHISDDGAIDFAEIPVGEDSGTIEVDDFSPFLIIAVNVIPEQPIAQWNVAPAAAIDISTEPTEPAEDAQPMPGESNAPWLWALVAAIALIVVAAAVVVFRKKRKNYQRVKNV